MDNEFRKGFEKTAKIRNLIKTIPKAARGTGLVSRTSRGVGELAEGAAKKAVRPKSSTAKKVSETVEKSTGSPHAKYMRSIGATGKKSKAADEVLKYRPSKTRAGLSEFDSITQKSKKRINGERGPLK